MVDQDDKPGKPTQSQHLANVLTGAVKGDPNSLRVLEIQQNFRNKQLRCLDTEVASLQAQLEAALLQERSINEMLAKRLKGE